MNEKTAPVDVLALLDAEIAREIARGEANHGDVTGLTEARAAIAELIEAAKVVHEQIDGPDYDGSCSMRAFDRLTAALARVGGGA